MSNETPSYALGNLEGKEQPYIPRETIDKGKINWDPLYGG